MLAASSYGHLSVSHPSSLRILLSVRLDATGKKQIAKSEGVNEISGRTYNVAAKFQEKNEPMLEQVFHLFQYSLVEFCCRKYAFYNVINMVTALLIAYSCDMEENVAL